jgi:hypothetical protein
VARSTRVDAQPRQTWLRITGRPVLAIFIDQRVGQLLGLVEHAHGLVGDLIHRLCRRLRELGAERITESDPTPQPSATPSAESTPSPEPKVSKSAKPDDENNPSRKEHKGGHNKGKGKDKRKGKP